jgi:hypothetical protein
MTDRQAMEIAMAALKELVAQTEGKFFAIKHDHFAMQDARFAIARLREALAPIEIEKVLGVKNDI